MGLAIVNMSAVRSWEQIGIVGVETTKHSTINNENKDDNKMNTK